MIKRRKARLSDYLKYNPDDEQKVKSILQSQPHGGRLIVGQWLRSHDKNRTGKFFLHLRVNGKNIAVSENVNTRPKIYKMFDSVMVNFGPKGYVRRFGPELSEEDREFYKLNEEDDEWADLNINGDDEWSDVSLMSFDFDLEDEDDDEWADILLESEDDFSDIKL